MPSLLLPILAGTLPPGYCWPASPQQFLLDISANQNAVLATGMAFYNSGDVKPSPENNAFPWFRTIDHRWYIFDGVWKSPVNYDQNERRWFAGDLTALQTYDGGDTGAASPYSGPMWIEDTDFQGRSPMHPGNIPSANPAKILALAENYGTGTAAIAAANLPATFSMDASLAGFRTNLETLTPQWLAHTNTGGSIGSTNPSSGIAHFDFTNTGGGIEFSKVHPVRGLYCIRWSGRQFRVAN